MPQQACRLARDGEVGEYDTMLDCDGHEGPWLVVARSKRGRTVFEKPLFGERDDRLRAFAAERPAHDPNAPREPGGRSAAEAAHASEVTSAALLRLREEAGGRRSAASRTAARVRPTEQRSKYFIG